MIPPKEAWRSMDSAPRDGSIFMALHKAYNARTGQDQVQACQYFCNEFGTDWRWRSPWRCGVTTYADAWMTFADFLEWQDSAAEPITPTPAPAAPAQDFDL